MRAIPIPILILLLVAPAGASEFNRALRAVRSDHRLDRREALEQFASGRLRPGSRAESDKLERALRRFLSDKHPGQERAWAVRALGRYGRARVFEDLLDHLDEERDDRVLRAMADSFRQASPELASVVKARISKATDPLARAALVRMLGALPGQEAHERMLLHARVADSWMVRATAAEALARYRDPEALPILMRLLDESDPALVAAATETLTRLTRLGHGEDRAAWKARWETTGKKEPFEKAEAEHPPDAKPDARRYAHETPTDHLRPYFFGIPVSGEGVVFVFDVSASMRYKLPLAYDQLTRAVKGLRSTARFEVIFFHERVFPWRGRLSHADPVTKELLVRHLPEIEIRSYTNLFDSIEAALELEPDEIMVISDGEPNRGRKQLPRDILSELERINPRRVRIHTVSVTRVVDGDEHVDLLEAIARAHGGEHVRRTLK